MDQDYLELIKVICARPKMFVYDGKFQTAAEFLSGYDWAKRDAQGQSELKDHFRYWLAEKYYKLNGTPRNLVLCNFSY